MTPQDSGTVVPNASAPAPAPAPAIHRMRVLLVEDNDGDAALVRASLDESSMGTLLCPYVDLRRATTLFDAKRLAAEPGFDAVLLDLGLPDSIGLDTLHEMRKATDVAIVVFTGLADEEVAVSALHQGAQDYLVKRELGPSVTLRSLRYARERRQQERAMARAQWLAGIGDTVLALMHEVNNPLTSLMMNAELLAAGDRDPRIAESVLAAARRIAEVTRRLSEPSDLKPVEVMDGLRMLDLSPR